MSHSDSPCRLKVTWTDSRRLSAREGAARKMRLLITSQCQEKERIRKLSVAVETEEAEKTQTFFPVKDQFSSLEDLCEKVNRRSSNYAKNVPGKRFR